MMEIQMLSEQEIQELLGEARSEVSRGPGAPVIPQIKLVAYGSTVLTPAVPGQMPPPGTQHGPAGSYQLLEGTYYVAERTKDDSGEFVDRVTPIGARPEIVILKRMYSYSWYSEREERMMAWTNEFPVCSRETVVHLINNRGDVPIIECSLPYPAFKNYIHEKYRDIEGRMVLKFRHVLYVLYGGGIYRMIVSNASATGVPEGERTGDYSNPQPFSLVSFENSLKGPQAGGMAWFERKCRLGSRLAKGSISYYVMTFENAGPLEDIRLAASAFKQLKTDLPARELARLPGERPAPAIEAPRPQAEVLPGGFNPPPISYQSEISPDDVPF